MFLCMLHVAKPLASLRHYLHSCQYHLPDVTCLHWHAVEYAWAVAQVTGQGVGVYWRWRAGEGGGGGKHTGQASCSEKVF